MSALISQRNKIGQFLRVYKKASKSPWADASTVLLLADIISVGDDDCKLGFEHYIYLHRSADGQCVGVSASKQLLRETPDFDGQSQYFDGIEMIGFLLLHTPAIKHFLSNVFAKEFSSVFLLSVEAYFSKAEIYWLEYLEDI
jgi:hypothetical protein